MITAYLRNQHLVPGLHTRLYPISRLVKPSRPNREHLGLVQLLDGALRQEDAARGLGLGFYPLDKDAVQKRRDGSDGLEGGRLRRRAGQLKLARGSRSSTLAILLALRLCVESGRAVLSLGVSGALRVFVDG